MSTAAGQNFSWVQILRLGLVQACLGAVVVTTTSTLNRVMVVELALPALLPGALVALHYLVQMLRPRLGHGSDVTARRTPWIVGGMAVLAVWVTVTITRPLARLTTAVAAVTRDGLGDSAPDAAPPALRIVPGTEARDEFGQLARGMDAMLQTLRTQWTTLRRLDHFRREGVSNLSHDLRSPLTATAACLETLQNRWDEPGAQAGNRELVTVALRNTHNAARLVRSLGDLAQLDEPAFTLRTSGLDMAELLNDVAMRFASRASAHGVALEAEEPDGPVVAVVDNELLERALANLADNALKFCPAGGRITLTARADAGKVCLTVRDTGPGIALAA